MAATKDSVDVGAEVGGEQAARLLLRCRRIRGGGGWIQRRKSSGRLGVELRDRALVEPEVVSPRSSSIGCGFPSFCTGKTLLMDMFYGATEGVTKHRRGFHFHETIDVFAIMVLSGILNRFVSTGTVLIATSNKAPEDLNQDGMQWDIFLDQNWRKTAVRFLLERKGLSPPHSNGRLNQGSLFWLLTSDTRSL